MTTGHPQLLLGTTMDGSNFTLPLDAVTRTFAVLAIRGAGKTTTAKRMAEEMTRCGLPWIAFDPVGVWYGIRATPDGKPGGYPVVVIGGQHGDLPLEKGAGERIAEALIAENICAVIDLSQESKTFWHTFVTDFALRLLSLNPTAPRHLFLEETPEFVPQRSSAFLTNRCREAVDRLVRLGRNQGYGCTLISQRPATVAKDVLSQCENLFVLRTVGPQDRKALQEWIDARGMVLEADWKELARLPNGTAWFWSPEWLDMFQRVTIWPSTTYHPGATRQVGQAAKAVQLADVAGFVSKLQRQLTKTTIPEVSTASKAASRVGVKRDERVVDDANRSPAANGGGALPRDLPSPGIEDKIEQLERELAEARQRAAEAERRLNAVRELLRADYDRLRAVFEEVGNGTPPATAAIYAPWLEKAGRAGIKRMLTVLIERRQVTRQQLATLTSISPTSGTYSDYLGWLRRNGLIEVAGDTVTLRPV